VTEYDEDTALLAVPNSDPVTPLPLRYSPLPLISSEPVIIALPENGNPAPAPALRAYDAVFAHEAVPNNDPEYIPRPVVLPPVSTSTRSVESARDVLIAREVDTAYEAESAYEEDTPYELVTEYEDDMVNEAVVALDEDSAQLEVPSKEPVTPLPLKYSPLPLMTSEPVIIALPENGKPVPLVPPFNAYEAVPNNEPL
jgi:hypothetical protein